MTRDIYSDTYGKKTVTNTSKMMEDPLMTHLFIKKGVDAIPQQERAGQQELVNSDTLPTRYNGRGDGEEILKELGFKLGDPVPGDNLFRFVELPHGWKREGSDHAMWSYILDADGNERMSVFYKAAFYDRKASFRLTCRFYADFEYRSKDSFDKKHMIMDKANLSSPLFVTDFIRRSDFPDTDEGTKAYQKADGAASKYMETKLESHFPDYRNPVAYWGKEGDDIIENNRLRRS